MYVQTQNATKILFFFQHFGQQKEQLISEQSRRKFVTVVELLYEYCDTMLGLVQCLGYVACTPQNGRCPI
jgi:hypothetical protein